MAKTPPTVAKDLLRTLTEATKQAHPDQGAAKAPGKGRKSVIPHVHDHTHAEAPITSSIRRTRGVKRGQ